MVLDYYAFSAHCSEDKILIQAFLDDEDIHTRTACEVFQVVPEMITPELRRQAKAIAYLRHPDPLAPIYLLGDENA